MTTPHIAAQTGEFAKTVLMPGDPLRAKHIAETFLENVEQVNSVRNMFGFTGTYRGKEVSVMGSGMGIPSISIYATELYREFGVENIIRVGTCGTVHPDMQIGEVVLGMGASTDSAVNRTRFGGYDLAALADYRLLSAAVDAAKRADISARVGNVFSADLFYSPDTRLIDLWRKHQILAIEMEAAGLYGVAAEHGKAALAIMTVSDHITRGEIASPEQRQTQFNDMIKMALEANYALD